MLTSMQRQHRGIISQHRQAVNLNETPNHNFTSSNIFFSFNNVIALALEQEMYQTQILIFPN